MHLTLQHANIDLRLGPLNWIVSLSALHRWHHSRVRSEADTNYGGVLLIWDVVFGTRVLPADREPPADTGLTGYPRLPDRLSRPDRLTVSHSPVLLTLGIFAAREDFFG